MTRRLTSLLVAVAVLCSCMAATVYASESSSDWIELLEFTSISDSGETAFSFTTTANIVLPLPQQMRLRKVDMLLSVPNGQAPNKITVTAGGSTFELDLASIGGNMVRAYGYVPNTMYTSIRFTITKATTSQQYYQILSCKVSTIGTEEFVCDADVYIDGGYWSISENIYIYGVADTHSAEPYQARISVYDWQKYDQLTIWGSVTDASIESIRATVSTGGLPISVNYMDMAVQTTWTEWTTDAGGDTGAALETSMYGKFLYCVTIDLTNVDRTKSDPLYLYMTGNFVDSYGMIFLCQYVNGSIAVADTSDVTWWNRFTTFMADLFNGDAGAADNFQYEAAQQGGEMDHLNDQLQEVTKPPIIDPLALGDISGKFSAFLGDSLILSMLMVVLTLALVAYILYGKR